MYVCVWFKIPGQLQIIALIILINKYFDKIICVLSRRLLLNIKPIKNCMYDNLLMGENKIMTSH